jgi:hypothetical protein
LPFQYTLAAAMVLASVYVFGNRLRVNSHHRTWVSVAAGVSVSTIFIDLLPEISESQLRFSTASERGAAIFPEQAIYIAAMLGFVLFFGLEYLIGPSRSGEDKPSRVFSTLRIVAFAGYSSLIAYLLVHSIWKSAPAFLLYSLAMAFHLLLVDHSLAQADSESYQRYGRWVLAASVLIGWFTAVLTLIPEPWLARTTGFVCGGVIMNSLVVELPEGRGGRFFPFVLAAAGYSLLLIAILG